MLYKELLISCKERFDEFFANVPIFENQFVWSDFNAKCYEAMYVNNTYKNIAEVKNLKEAIPELKDICKKCAEFYIPQRNKKALMYQFVASALDTTIAISHELAPNINGILESVPADTTRMNPKMLMSIYIWMR